MKPVHFITADVQQGCPPAIKNYGNINVPWWYVQSILEKFSFEVKPTTDKEPKRIVNIANAPNSRSLVYRFNQKTQWTDLFLSTADLDYESNHWLIASPTGANAGYAVDTLYWFPDRLIDLSRYNVSIGAFLEILPMPAQGVINITLTGGDYTTGLLDDTEANTDWQQALVWGQNQIDLKRPTSWPRVVGGLRYPDPFWDWLWEGAKKIGPHLITGNYGNAAAEAFSHLATPAAIWAGDKIKTWVDQRFQ